jgi:hypothetical protein
MAILRKSGKIQISLLLIVLFRYLRCRCSVCCC